MGCCESTQYVENQTPVPNAPEKMEDPYNSTPQPQPKSKGGIEEECLSAHNTYRAKHHSPPLKLSPELCEISKNYAEKLAATDTFQHSDNKWNGKDLGENIYMGYKSAGKSPSGQEITDSWYSEIKDYKTYGNDFNPNAGHFTQVVWKETQLLGVGVAQSKNGAWYGVCNYYPAGNTMGKFQTNVLKP